MLTCLIIILIPILILLAIVLIEDGKENGVIKEEITNSSYELVWDNYPVENEPIIELKDLGRFEMTSNDHTIKGDYKLKLGNRITSGKNSLFLAVDKGSDTSWYVDDEEDEFFRIHKNKKVLIFYHLVFTEKGLINVYSNQVMDEPDVFLRKVD